MADRWITSNSLSLSLSLSVNYQHRLTESLFSRRPIRSIRFARRETPVTVPSATVLPHPRGWSPINLTPFVPAGHSTESWKSVARSVMPEDRRRLPLRGCDENEGATLSASWMRDKRGASRNRRPMFQKFNSSYVGFSLSFLFLSLSLSLSSTSRLLSPIFASLLRVTTPPVIGKCGVDVSWFILSLGTCACKLFIVCQKAALDKNWC